MSFTNEEVAVAPVEPEVSVPVSPFSVDQSILSGLAASRAKIGEGADPIDLPIPGYNGLVARYAWRRAEDLAATSKSLQAIKNPTTQQLAMAADTIGACNIGLFFKVDDKLEPIHHQEQIVTFDNCDAFIAALGLVPVRSRREAVLTIFGNDYAVMEAAFTLNRWLGDTSLEINEEVLGE